MKGCMPLTDDDLTILKNHFINKEFSKNDPRDHLFIFMGCYLGFRASELLSLKVTDVYDLENQRVHDTIKIKKEHCKGKHASKVSIIVPELKKIIESYVINHGQHLTYLFQSVRDGSPLCYRQMLRSLREHFDACGFQGKSFSTHSFRKSYACRMYQQMNGDLPALQQALNHKNISSTISYVSVDRDKILESMKKLKF